MEEGSRGQLDLSPFHKPAVQGDNFLDRRALERENFVFVVFSKAAIFLAQVSQTGILLDGAVSEPGQIVPYLQIEEFLCRKVTGDPRKILAVHV